MPAGRRGCCFKGLDRRGSAWPVQVVLRFYGQPSAHFASVVAPWLVVTFVRAQPLIVRENRK